MIDLITTEQVAVRFGVKSVTVRSWVAKKLLTGQKIGGILLFTETDLAAFEKPAHGGGRPRKEKDDASHSI